MTLNEEIKISREATAREEELELARETVVRLSRENQQAGDAISQIARAVGALSSDLHEILRQIERLNDRATHVDNKCTEGSARSILLEVAKVLDMDSRFDIKPEQVLAAARQQMGNLRYHRNTPRPIWR